MAADLTPLHVDSAAPLGADPVLSENPERFTLLPPRFPHLYAHYEAAVHSFWTSKEVDMSRDRADFSTLTPSEQHFIKHILAFFANFDNVVNENLAARFMKEVQLPEARAFYAQQISIEQIHAVVYALQIEELVTDPHEKLTIQRAIHTVPAIKQMADWALKWISSPDATFGERLVAFSIIEGVVFSGAFCAIYWIGYYKKKCAGLVQANEWIARDEGLHTRFACELHHLLTPPHRASPVRILEIMQEVLPFIEEFITSSLPYDLPLMNASLMRQYIHYVADRHLQLLECEPHYRVSNPFPFMEAISYNKQTNFFEKRVTEYGLADRAPGPLGASSIDDA